MIQQGLIESNPNFAKQHLFIRFTKSKSYLYWNLNVQNIRTHFNNEIRSDDWWCGDRVITASSSAPYIRAQYLHTDFRWSSSLKIFKDQFRNSVVAHCVYGARLLQLADDTLSPHHHSSIESRYYIDLVYFPPQAIERSNFLCRLFTQSTILYLSYCALFVS